MIGTYIQMNHKANGIIKLIIIILMLGLLCACQRRETTESSKEQNSQQNHHGHSTPIQGTEISTESEIIKFYDFQLNNPILLTEEYISIESEEDVIHSQPMDNDFTQRYNGDELEKDSFKVRLSVANQTEKMMIYGSDMELLAFWLHGSQEEVILGDIEVDEEAMTEYTHFLAGIEQGPRQFDVIYQLNFNGQWKTFISRFTAVGSLSRLCENTTFRRESTMELDIDVKQVFKESNSIWIEHSVEDKRYLSCLNLDYDSVMDIDLSEALVDDSLMIWDVFYKDNDGQLMVNFLEYGGKTRRYISVPYKNTGASNHIVGCGNYYFVNGEPTEKKVYVKEHILELINIDGQTYLESNGHLVIQEFYPKPHEYFEIAGERLVIYDINEEQIVVKDMYGNEVNEVIAYSEGILGDHIKDLLENHGTAYISSRRFDLIIVECDNQEETRIKLPEPVREQFASQQYGKDHHKYLWEPIDGAIAFQWHNEYTDFVNQISTLYLYLLEEETFVNVETNVQGYIDIYNGQVRITNNYEYVFDIKDMKFHIVHEDVYKERKPFVYNDIFYSYDYGYDHLDETINDQDQYKSFDEMEPVATEAGDVAIFDSKGRDNYQCVLTVNNQIGSVNDGIWEPISELSVRIYESNPQGVIYSGYGEEAYGYYYDWATGVTYTHQQGEVFNEVTLINDKIYVLTEGHIISRYDVNTLEEGKPWQPDLVFDVNGLESEDSHMTYNMEGNGEYLAIYKNSIYWWENTARTIQIYDADLEHMYTYNGSFVTLMDDYLVMYVGNYLLKCDLTSGEQGLITSDRSVYPLGFLDETLVLRHSGEQYGLLQAYNIESDPAMATSDSGKNQITVSYGDLSIEVIMSDFENQEFKILGYFNHIEDIWIEENTLYVKEDNITTSYELPSENFEIIWW